MRDNGIVMLEGLRHCGEHLRKGLCHCGEHLREALRGASSFRFTVSPASILKFFWALFVFVFVWFVLGSVFFLVFHGFEINLVVLRTRTTVGAVMACTAWEKKKSSCVPQ